MSLPKHVAIIMDGNGRWANSRRLPRILGHREGVKRAREIVEHARKIGVSYLTLYTFSTENWKRPKDEIDTLFALLKDNLISEKNLLMENNVRLNVVGDLEPLPEDLKKELLLAQEESKSNSAMVLNMALNYGGRQEILRAVDKIVEGSAGLRVRESRVTESEFERYLYTAGQPDPDLLIRTSGEMRISNFLLWQVSYTEIYVTEKFWPDFRPSDFDAALDEFQRRQRRHGASPFDCAQGWS